MSLTPEDWQRAIAVLEASTNSFVELVEVAGLDRGRDFRRADLSKVDFGTDDIAGFDFTGANLEKANLSRVRGLEHAVLTGARLKGAQLPAPPREFDVRTAQRAVLGGRMPPKEWWVFLTSLRFTDPKFTELESISVFANLRTLYLNNTLVYDLAPLASLVNLRVLHLESTPVDDLSPLAACRDLERLDIDGTKVVSVEPLRNLLKLHSLSAERTQITDFLPIAYHRWLTVKLDNGWFQGKDFRVFSSNPAAPEK